MNLTRESFLSFKVPPPRAVEVPAMGGKVYVRVLNGSIREQLEAAAREQGDEVETSRRATLLAFVLCDENGNPLFTPDDIPALNELPAEVIMRLFNVALDVNALGEDASEDLKKN